MSNELFINNSKNYGTGTGKTNGCDSWERKKIEYNQERI